MTLNYDFKFGDREESVLFEYDVDLKECLNRIKEKDISLLEDLMRMCYDMAKKYNTGHLEVLNDYDIYDYDDIAYMVEHDPDKIIKILLEFESELYLDNELIKECGIEDEISDLFEEEAKEECYAEWVDENNRHRNPYSYYGLKQSDFY